jgi:hypothetical protein
MLSGAGAVLGFWPRPVHPQKKESELTARSDEVFVSREDCQSSPQGGAMADSAQISSPADLAERLVSGLSPAAAAFEQVAAAPSPQAAAMAPEVVRRLVSEVVPRLQAELAVLLPPFAQFLVPPEVIAGLGSARTEAGMLAEQLSGIVYNLAPADVRGAAYVKRTARKLAELLRRHVALELSLGREFLEPNFGHTEADGLLLSLSAAEARAKDAMVFVAPPAYLPTEARVLRHNPRAPAVVRLRDIEEV